MARVFYVDWDKEAALQVVKELRGAGHVVQYHYDREDGASTWKRIKSKPPDALVVSLQRLPSHGRRVAAVTLETKKFSHIPIVFVDGAPEKVAVARKEYPKAQFTTAKQLLKSLEKMFG